MRSSGSSEAPALMNRRDGEEVMANSRDLPLLQSRKAEEIAFNNGEMLRFNQEFCYKLWLVAVMVKRSSWMDSQWLKVEAEGLVEDDSRLWL